MILWQSWGHASRRRRARQLSTPLEARSLRPPRLVHFLHAVSPAHSVWVAGTLRDRRWLRCNLPPALQISPRHFGIPPDGHSRALAFLWVSIYKHGLRVAGWHWERPRKRDGRAHPRSNSHHCRKGDPLPFLFSSRLGQHGAEVSHIFLQIRRTLYIVTGIVMLFFVEMIIMAFYADYFTNIVFSKVFQGLDVLIEANYVPIVLVTLSA